jgi:hypothetical protein
MKTQVEQSQHTGLLVRAWAWPSTHHKSNSAEWFARCAADQPDIFLKRVAVFADGTIEFRAFDPLASPGAPLLASALASATYQKLRSNLDEGWLVLEGSTDPWAVDRRVADANAGGQVVLFVRKVKATTSYYAFADAYHNPPRVGLTTSNPPVTGGTIFWQLETEETDQRRRLEALKQLGPQFQLENDKGQIIGKPCRPDAFGLDEAIMEASAYARLDPDRVMRLVAAGTEGKTLLRSWPRAA